MTVADVGSGFGAMTVVLGRWIGSGRVFATDITEHALRQTREYVKNEGLMNVTVIEGAEAATNLPDACCDAIFLRNVYHHITAVEAFNRSLVASLKPGGRLAIIDFEDRSGGQIPKGVPANRGGHGVPPGIVIDELEAAGLTHISTTKTWPPGEPTFLALFRKWDARSVSPAGWRQAARRARCGGPEATSRPAHTGRAARRRHRASPDLAVRSAATH